MSTTTEKITMRAFLEAISENEAVPVCYRAKADEELKKLDEKNSSRANKKNEANAPLIAQIITILTNNKEGMLSSELAELCEVNTSKITGICGVLIKEGRVISEKVKIKGVNGTRTKYYLA